MKWLRFFLPVTTVGPEAAMEMLASDAPPVLVDVREPSEYAEQRLEGAVLIPLGQIGNRCRELDVDRPVLVYCRSGIRSNLAARKLAVKGFRQVINMAGGIVKWPGKTV